MIDKKDLSLMDTLLDAVSQSFEWSEALSNDPYYAKADQQFERVMAQLEPYLPVELDEAIRNCKVMCETGVERAAMLYGLHVADVIRTVSAAPLELSQYILDRLAGKEAGE